MSRPNVPAAPAAAHERGFLHDAVVGIGKTELVGRSAHHRGRSIGGRAEQKRSRQCSGCQQTLEETLAHAKSSRIYNTNQRRRASLHGVVDGACLTREAEIVSASGW
jgi:hypothetical protein